MTMSIALVTNVVDLETNGLYNEVTTIHCLVLHDLNRDQTFTYGPDNIAAGLEHLATADVLIGQNILFYDIKQRSKQA
jgi:DNA polymerase I